MITADAAIKFIRLTRWTWTHTSLFPIMSHSNLNNDMCQQINVKERLGIASLYKIIVTQNAFRSTNNLKERLYQKQKFERKI